MKQLERDKIELQGQLRDLEWRLDNESKVYTCNTVPFSASYNHVTLAVHSFSLYWEAQWSNAYCLGLQIKQSGFEFLLVSLIALCSWVRQLTLGVTSGKI